MRERRGRWGGGEGGDGGGGVTLLTFQREAIKLQK